MYPNVSENTEPIHQQIQKDDKEAELIFPTSEAETSQHVASKRPPKLRSLRGQATFSKTVAVDDGLSPKLRPKVTRQMSQQDRPRPTIHNTPKRKCSFSSFSECRFVVDGGQTTTFLFSIETPSSPPPNNLEEIYDKENDHDNSEEKNEESLTPIIKRWKYHQNQDWSSRETDRSSCTSAATTAIVNSNSNGIDIRDNPMFGVVGFETGSRNSSPSPLPSPKHFAKENLSNESKLPLSSDPSNGSLQKAGSLISMTSQVRNTYTDRIIFFYTFAAKILQRNIRNWPKIEKFIVN